MLTLYLVVRFILSNFLGKMFKIVETSHRVVFISLVHNSNVNLKQRVRIYMIKKYISQAKFDMDESLSLELQGLNVENCINCITFQRP